LGNRHGSLPFFAMGLWTPEGKEGVNAVNDPVGATRVGVKDLGTAIYRYHGGGAVSDFAWNIEGNIVGNIDGKVCHGNHGKPVFVFKMVAVAFAVMACHKLPQLQIYGRYGSLLFSAVRYEVALGKTWQSWHSLPFCR